MILGYLFSGLFTTYYVVTESWYKNFTDFKDCKTLPISLIFIQFINLTLVVYLVIFNLYKCICKAVTNNKITTAFNCCSCIYLILIIGAYIFASYVFFSKTCYENYIITYPNLWLCLEVTLGTLVGILSLSIIGGIASCIVNKKKNLRKITHQDYNKYKEMV